MKINQNCVYLFHAIDSMTTSENCVLSVISKFFDSSVFEGTLGDLFLRGLRSSIFDGARVDLFFLVFDLRLAPAEMAFNMFVMAIVFFEALPFNILSWYCVMNCHIAFPIHIDKSFEFKKTNIHECVVCAVFLAAGKGRRSELPRAIHLKN